MSGFTHEAPVQGATNEWYTPESIFDLLVDENGERLTFDLDPCHPAERLPWVPVWEKYSLPQDGLTLPWFGRVWLNPPYGKETPRWLERMHDFRDGMALVFSRADNDWFHSYVREADGVLFLRKRVQFVDKTGKPPLNAQGKASSPGAGSMLVAWGDVCRGALIRATFNDREVGTFADLS